MGSGFFSDLEKQYLVDDVRGERGQDAQGVGVVVDGDGDGELGVDSELVGPFGVEGMVFVDAEGFQMLGELEAVEHFMLGARIFDEEVLTTHPSTIKSSLSE